jgi:tRNA-uridine 2-sulfurtransferase
LSQVQRIGRGVKGGAILSRTGEKLGEHDGIHGFTVGQRRGIGVGGTAEPLYVLSIDPESREVIVGAKSDLEVGEFFVQTPNWVAPSVVQHLASPDGGREFKALAQLRHRHPGVVVDVSILPDGTARARFASGWTPVSPGQAAVFYDLSNTEVLGGGTIARR